MTQAKETSMDVIIYHNPACGTSRNTLGLIRNAGIEPHVIAYLDSPPTRAKLAELIERMRISCCAARARPMRNLASTIPNSPTTN